ncbi:MAG: peptide deformylase [Rikenellaceae bacterium]|nr:peptide deformylase [Rikenellaceae bacterium]MCL2692645.1 peptide deformylase [Rikenellaceae bacterium]
MIRSIHVHGSPVLRQQADEVPRDHADLPQLLADMYETMYASGGIGLAAPQVGVPLRLFVVDLSPYADEEPALLDMKKVFINPEIYDESDEEVLMNEGCLSIPGLTEDVYRPEKIRLRWLDENFEPHDAEFDGHASRVIQHEYDHLVGKIYTDHLSMLRRTLLRGRLSAIARGDYTAKYKTKQK